MSGAEAEAEELPPSRLDNAGSLQHSLNAGLAKEKISVLPGYEAGYMACTFCLEKEDHTLGNALRWMIMKDEDVEFCGYSAPHPSEAKIHLRIQMYDNPDPGKQRNAVDCLRTALGNLGELFSAINDKYAASLKHDRYIKEEDPDVRGILRQTLADRGLGGDEEMSVD